MGNLADEINRLNKIKKNEPRDLEKFKRRITRKNEIAQFKKDVKNTFNSIVDYFHEKKRLKEEKLTFEKSCYQSYEEFLNMADNGSNKYGIETFETHFGPGTIIFTHSYGPFVKTPTTNSQDASAQSYLYEGFAKDPSGFFKYYNLKIEKISNYHSPDKVITLVSGFALDPKNNSLEVIEESLDSKNHFVEDYYNLIEKTTTSIEKYKQ